MDELIDRYGEPPRTVNNLISVALLRAAAAEADITDIAQKNGQLIFTLEQFRLEPFSLLCGGERYRNRLLLIPGDVPRFTLRLRKGGPTPAVPRTWWRTMPGPTGRQTEKKFHNFGPACGKRPPCGKEEAVPMDHKDYMRRALELAAQAGEEGDVPVGCVIVRDGAIVGRGATAGRRTATPPPTRSWRPSGTPAAAWAAGGSTGVPCTSPWSPAPCVPEGSSTPGWIRCAMGPGRQGGGLRLGAQPV